MFESSFFFSIVTLFVIFFVDLSRMLGRRVRGAPVYMTHVVACVEIEALILPSSAEEKLGNDTSY
jgi:uncharacterized membrane protein